MNEFISWLTQPANLIDITLAVIFAIFTIWFLVKNKKNVSLEKIAFPILYAFLYRGTFGIKWMEKYAKKYKEAIILFGYISIGIGFVGMIAAFVLILYVAYQLIFTPNAASVAPFLPFVEVPVLGYISFSHWIITIFVIVLIHEGAHGLVALAHGLKVKKTGFGAFAIFIPFLPAAFVEPDDKKIAKADPVIQHSIFAAGPMSNFVLMIPLILLFLLVLNPIEANITDQDGFTFDIITNESYPAELAGLEDGMTFNTLNGEPTETIEDFYREIQWMKPGQNISLGYNDEYTYTLTLTTNPTQPESGFLGVQNLRNNVFIKEQYMGFAPFFSWFKGLMLLMLEITFSLGIINLFPASITDGGRMFSLALDRISPNKKLNKKVVGGLALFFIAIIFFALITYFTGNPFMLFFG